MVPSYGTPLQPLSKQERKALKAKHRKTPAPLPLRIGRPAPERSADEIAGCQIHVLFAGKPPPPGSKRMSAIAKAHFSYPTAPPLEVSHVLGEMIYLSRVATSDRAETPLADKVWSAYKCHCGAALIQQIAGPRGSNVAWDITTPDETVRERMATLLTSEAAERILARGHDPDHAHEPDEAATDAGWTLAP